MAAVKKGFRLNQAVAKSGFSSRREADRLIAAGRVSVNGEPVTDFNRVVDPDTDELRVDGKILRIKQYIYVAMYKPRGVVTTCADELGRKQVLDLLPLKLHHLRPVGRLDMDSEGLLIFTNDGNLTQRLTHPLHHLPKRYLVTVKGRLGSADLERMSAGLVLSDGKTQPARASLVSQDASASTFELVLREGRNRQIRRMCAQLGYPVQRLVREGIGRLQLGQMTPGSWRYLTAAEISQLGCQ